MSIEVRTARREDADALATFASARTLAWTDFASIALLQPDEPRVWIAIEAGTIVAAAIDDGLAMSIGGSVPGLHAIAAVVPDLAAKLVIAGRTEEVRSFVETIDGPPRRERREHFMSVGREELLCPFEPVALRIATEADLPMLMRVRAAALEEEYEIPVPQDSDLYRELASAVTRAVSLQGVAIWVEDDRCAFTAQLIAKTPDASMFGDLYVDRDLRGAGRATRALTAFCTWLMSESEHVVLRVGQSNTPAVRLYERVGFSVVDEFCTSLGADAP
jgi:ribosomal protein S18 acetylase RimI-like enzyme